MSNQPRLSRLSLWERYKAECLSIVASATERLPLMPPDTGEVELNMELARRIYAVIHERSRADPDAIVWAPASDCLNIGATRDQEGADLKKPDLQWILIDSSLSSTDSSRALVVECKRLGIPSAAGFNFNVAYVKSGIARFVDVRWKYGRNADVGVMVGYVQAMEFSEVLAAVNAAVVAAGLPAISQAQATSELALGRHSLDREFEMSPIELLHLWKNVTAVPPA